MMSSLKYPPREAWEHLRKLYRVPGAFNRFFSKNNPRLAELKALDRFEERGLIRHIAFLLFDPDFTLASEAGEMIHKRLSGISARELCELDQAMRENIHYQFQGASGYYLEDLAKLERFTNPIPFLGICSFSPNGYIREQAVRRLSHFKDGKEIKFLLLRLNDWVPQVRMVAKTEIISRIDTEHIANFVDNLDLFERIYSWDRDDHSNVLNLFEDALAHPHSRDQLIRGLNHSNFRIRRLSVKIAAGKKTILPMDLYKIVARDPDPIVRLQFVTHAKPFLDQKDLSELTSALSSDGFMPIRREAINLSVQNGLENSMKLLKNALCDNHSSIREFARWHLKKQGKSQSHFQSIYREAIKHDPPQIGALSGIGEVGEADDVQRVFPFLDHERARLRKAAFRAIANINPEELKDVVLERLQNDTPSVVKEAGNYIVKHLQFYYVPDLWDIFLNTERHIVKVCLLSIIERMSKWQRVIYLLGAGEEQSLEIRSIVVKHLDTWMFSFNRSFKQPTSEEISKIKDFISKSSLDPRLLKDLGNFLKYY